MQMKDFKLMDNRIEINNRNDLQELKEKHPDWFIAIRMKKTEKRVLDRLGKLSDIAEITDNHIKMIDGNIYNLSEIIVSSPDPDGTIPEDVGFLDLLKGL